VSLPAILYQTRCEQAYHISLLLNRTRDGAVSCRLHPGARNWTILLGGARGCAIAFDKIESSSQNTMQRNEGDIRYRYIYGRNDRR
jgi:hypothetical protein